MLLAIGGIANATVATKQIVANYNNLRLYVNGKLLNLSATEEPFILNGVTFVPLRAAGEALGSYINWDSATKSIRISSGASDEVTTLKAQLAQMGKENAALKAQNETLKTQLDKKTSLSDLEDNLIDDYASLKTVPIKDITLDGDKDNVKVKIKADMGKYKSKWADLTDRNITSWLGNLVGDIQNELTSRTVIEGVIINTVDNRDLVKFSKDGKNALKVTFKDASYRGGDATAVQNALAGETYSVSTLDFTVSSVKYDATYAVTKVYLIAEDNNSRTVWNGLSSTTIKSGVKVICSDIAGLYDDENVNLDTLRVYFYDKAGVLLKSYTYDVSSKTLS